MVESFPLSWAPQIQFSTMAWVEQDQSIHWSQAGVHGKVVTRNPELLSQTSLCLASGAVLLCLSQLITVPSLSYSCRVVELLHMVGGALVITLCVSRWGVSCGGWLPSEIWATSGGCCLSRCQQWPLLPHSGITLGLGHLCVPWSSLFPGDGFPRSNCCAMTQNRQDGSVAWYFGLGCMASWLLETQRAQSKSFSALPQRQPMHALLMSGVQSSG